MLSYVMCLCRREAVRLSVVQLQVELRQVGRTHPSPAQTHWRPPARSNVPAANERLPDPITSRYTPSDICRPRPADHARLLPQ